MTSIILSVATRLIFPLMLLFLAFPAAARP